METLHAPAFKGSIGVPSPADTTTSLPSLHTVQHDGFFTEDLSFQKKQTRLALIITGLWTLVQLITFFKNLFIYNLLAEPIDYSSQLSKRAIPWATGLAFIFIINYSSKYLLKTNIKLVHFPFVHFLIASLISIIIYLSSYYVISVTGAPAFETSSVIKYFMIEIDRLFLVYLLISITTTAHHYFHEIRRKETALKDMESAYRESKILSLNNEVNPHMLFNVLNNIYTVVSSNRQHAKKMILDFSDLLRENLRNQASIYITLSHEKIFLKNYINLQNPDRIRYEIQFIDDDHLADEALIPKMILQPLVENAIKHTNLTGRNSLLIEIKSSVKQNYLHLCVRNKMSKQNNYGAASKIGIGTSNILRRLELLYSKDFEFKIRKDKNIYACHITIPFHHKPLKTRTT